MKLKCMLVVLTAVVVTVAARALTVGDLRVQTLKNPQGIDEETPSLSWKLFSAERGVLQESYQIMVSTDPAGANVVWESGRIESQKSVGIKFDATMLEPSTRYYWSVTVTDNHGNEARSTERAYFDTGLRNSGWSGARWLRPSSTPYGHAPGETAVKEYTIEAEFEIEQVAAGICFGKREGDNYYMWQFNVLDQNNPKFRPHVWSSGNPSVIAEVSVAGKLQRGKVHKVKIEVTNNATFCNTYLDGQLIDSRSGKFPYSIIGMREDHDPSAIEIAYFDNIKVTDTTNGTVLFSEDFTTDNSFTEGTIVDGRLKVVGAMDRQIYAWQATEGAPMFLKNFNVDKKVVSAKLYSTALGVYDLYVNGSRVGHLQTDGSTIYEELKPGWTDYRKRVFYSSHDVTHLFREGRNTLGAVVTSGWWAGAVAKGIYGNPSTAFLAKLVVKYDDGSQEIIVTDETWASSRRCPIRSGEIYDGEVYDARVAFDWDADLSTCNAVESVSVGNIAIENFKGPFVRTLDNLHQRVKSATVYEGVKSGTDYGTINVVSSSTSPSIRLKKGQTVIYDFGQNLAGWVEFKVKGGRSTHLRARFAEFLNDTGERSRGNDGPGGSIYTLNLRSAKAELQYTLSGDESGESYHPSTTFYGFRYCEITATDDIEILDIESVPLTSSHEETGTLQTSSQLVNQLISNIVWGQRSNILSVPTDCPQRDERLGWTADTQVFSITGMYNANLSTFYQKWLADLRDGQLDNGAYPCIAPISWTESGDAAWGDAGVIVPWSVYTMTGDPTVLRESFDANERFMDWMLAQGSGSYKYNGGNTAHGDWLSTAQTDARYVAVTYYAYDAQIMAWTAGVLSETPGDRYDVAAQKYSELFDNIKAEFQKRYHPRKVLVGASQTAYLLALKIGLYNDMTQRDEFIAGLKDKIESNGNRLNTGFVGTAILNTTLTEVGLSDYAYNLLLQRQYPSWLYSIDQGATTMWERWNSYTLEKGFGDAAMNSFNHYAYGAVGEWMYRHMAGIDCAESAPGFSRIVFRPYPDFRAEIPQGQERITSVSATYTSAYGEIRA